MVSAVPVHAVPAAGVAAARYAGGVASSVARVRNLKLPQGLGFMEAATDREGLGYLMCSCVEMETLAKCDVVHGRRLPMEVADQCV